MARRSTLPLQRSTTVTELRTDWLTGRTVLLAENRAAAAERVCGQGRGERVAACDGPLPFLSGSGSDTPPAVLTRADDDGRWRVRVVPNKFPAVAIDEPAAAGRTK